MEASEYSAFESSLSPSSDFQILNPKSIAMGELYGEFHPLTQEWHDGLVPSIFREYVNEESDDKRNCEKC